MANLQNLERTVLMAVVGFFSLIVTIILLCFCLFTVYNCFYKRMAQDYLKRMESETQTTDVENNAFLQEYDEILNGRHELMTRSLDCEFFHSTPSGVTFLLVFLTGNLSSVLISLTSTENY